MNYYASPLNVGDFRSFFTQTSKFFVCFSDFIDKNYVQNNIKLINAVYNDVFKDIPYMLKNILEYINSNYQNSSLTLSSIAERFWVNPSYLSRYFKTYMGINIVQYIRSMRIFYAKSLLQSSDMSIAEVAEKVGVKSASHFSKIFENEVGESPSKFRKSYFDRNHS